MLLEPNERKTTVPSGFDTIIRQISGEVAVTGPTKDVNPDVVMQVIDRHISFESKLQGGELTPITLCEEQQVSLASDINYLTGC